MLIMEKYQQQDLIQCFIQSLCGLGKKPNQRFLSLLHVNWLLVYTN